MLVSPVVIVPQFKTHSNDNNGLDLYGTFLDTQSALTGFQVPFIHTGGGKLLV